MTEQLSDSRIAYFFEAVQRGTIRAAADWLDVAPSAVSRQISLLESELGVTLIERHARGITTTEAGNCVVEYFREQLAHRDDLLSRLQALRGLKTGKVSIALGEGFVTDVLAGPMTRFSTQYPGIKVQFDVGSTNDVVRKVSEDESDIGLLYNAPPEPKLVTRASMRQPMVALISKQLSRKLTGGRMSVHDLKAFPLASMYPSYGIRQMLQAVEYAEKIALEPVVTSNSFSVLKHFALSGLGVAVMPAFAAGAELKSGEIIAVEIEHPLLSNAQAALVSRTGRRLSAAASKMLQLMTAQMRAFR